MAGNRPGPRPKGDRVAMHVRVPRSHREIYERLAAEAGLPLGDYVAIQLARGHDLKDPEYVHRNSDQLALLATVVGGVSGSDPVGAETGPTRRRGGAVPLAKPA